MKLNSSLLTTSWNACDEFVAMAKVSMDEGGLQALDRITILRDRIYPSLPSFAEADVAEKVCRSKPRYAHITGHADA